MLSKKSAFLYDAVLAWGFGAATGSSSLATTLGWTSVSSSSSPTSTVSGTLDLVAARSELAAFRAWRSCWKRSFPLEKSNSVSGTAGA